MGLHLEDADGRLLTVVVVVTGDDARAVTKNEFVDRVASKSGLSRRAAAKAVDAFFESITDALRRGDSVTFTGFGKFSTAQRAAREGVNPRNPSQKLHIPAATVPKFSVGSALKLAVRGADSEGEPDEEWDPPSGRRGPR